MHWILRVLSVMCLLVVLPAEDQNLDQQIAATDFTDANQVYALALWCKDHRLPSKSKQYLAETIRIDKDHEGARTALGYVRRGDKWIPKSLAPPGSATASGTDNPPPAMRPAVPGPTSAQMKWDLTIPVDPEPTNGFITKYVERMNKVGNDSDEMDISVATCIEPKYWPSALPRLCQALLRPDFTNLYGAGSIVLELARKNRTSEAKPLLPFLVKASERMTNAEDIEAFCEAVAALKDRRVIPRLMELYEAGGSIGKSAASSISRITLIPAANLTPDKAHEWWDINHNVSDRDTWKAQLHAADQTIALASAKELYQYHDNDIVPVILKCLRNDDLRIRRDAIQLVSRITGDDWGFDPAGPLETRIKIADRLDGWWKEEHTRFQWKEDTKVVNSTTTDPITDLVNRLDSTEGTRAADAEVRLRELGTDAVPALISGLSNPGSIVRSRAYEILKVTSKQDFVYDPRADEEARAKSIAKWNAWWKQQHPNLPENPNPSKSEQPPVIQHEVP